MIYKYFVSPILHVHPYALRSETQYTGVPCNTGPTSAAAQLLISA